MGITQSNQSAGHLAAAQTQMGISALLEDMSTVIAKGGRGVFFFNIT